MNGPKKYYGKYRGVVVDNVDLLHLGRIQAIVPDVSNVIPTTWAMPCVPIANKAAGTFVVPQIGSGVWIEFEHGDPDHPIWVGGYWGIAAETPPLSLLATPGDPPIIISTTAQHTIMLSDLPLPPLATGGILLLSGASSVMIGPESIQITSPSILVNGVTVFNAGALVVALP